MDTKLKKSHKITTLIIALCVMIPALLLVSLYPTMEKAMLEKRETYLKLEGEKATGAPEWVITDDFVNYAMEASYYLHTKMMESATSTSIDYDIFKQYGWDNDYWYVNENTTYIATYMPEGATEPIVQKNAEELDPQLAKLTLAFDAYGNITEAELDGAVEIYENDRTKYEIAERSNQQFHDNVTQYESDYGKEIDENQYIPKNFKVEFALNEDSEFVWDYDEFFGVHGWYDTSAENLYFVIGAYWLVVALVVIVVLAAFLLPFVKPLNTGREKIFSLPFEIMSFVGMGAVFLTIGMSLIMSCTTMWELTSELENDLPKFLGYEISIDLLYKLLLCVNFIGWAASFFLIYVVASAIRQMITRPLYYLKHQVLCIRLLRWMKRKCKSLYDYIIAIDINEKLNMSIIKIVVANFVILTLLCCMWFFGVAALIVYSIALYVILRKEGEKIQKQYHSILHATEQMADGDLKISLEEDLGVFTPIGESLEKVQQGFEKAVVEEAKSQNMKTELITNVSHDLKTPLTAIITYVDLLKKEDITEEERKSYIATLDQKSQRLKVLIEDLFEVSKAHSGNVKMNFMDVDVVSLLKQVRSEMDEQIENSNLQFRWNLPEEKVILALDGQRTYRVFENLLNNILKYAMPHSRVYVDVNPTDSQVQIQFRNVSAMELDFDADRLTERFVRGDSSRNTEGSGLGLAIAKSFVELQKGTFEIDVDGDLFKVRIMFDRK
ncbi:MAG: sensor histidine kinase [Tyzzerella sp.]|nr:sensor histidine kinase [Tyzzerella sp.]